MKRIATGACVLIAACALLVSACAEQKPKPEPKQVAATPEPQPAPKPEPVVEEPVEPKASFEVVSISEHGDKRDLERSLEQKVAAFNDCYVKQLAQEPGIAGDVRFELNISAGGKVDSVTVRGGTLNDDRLEACTEQVFKTVSVPALDSGEDADAHVVMSYVAG